MSVHDSYKMESCEEVLRDDPDPIKIIYMWVKQGYISLAEFRYLLGEGER